MFNLLPPSRHVLSGVYTTFCYRFFICGLIFSYLTHALPYIEPEFLPTPSNVTYTRGELAVLYCAVKNLGSKYVSWRKTSDPNPLTVGSIIYSPDNRIHISYIEYRNEWNLYIKNVTHQDAGIYECQVSIKMRDMRRYSILNVLESPVSTSPVYQKQNKGKLSSNTKRGTDRTEILRKSARNRNGCTGLFSLDRNIYLFVLLHFTYHYVML